MVPYIPSNIFLVLCYIVTLLFIQMINFNDLILNRFISENMGGYIGASLGGFTYDKIGFEDGTNVVIGMQVMKCYYFYIDN